MYFDMINKGLASFAVCAMGAFSMEITGGETGVGWSIIGIYLIWTGE